jgi:predicted ATPase
MLPDRVTSASMEWLMRSEAAQLFFERARAVKPDCAVVPNTVAAIAEICSWLV